MNLPAEVLQDAEADARRRVGQLFAKVARTGDRSLYERELEMAREMVASRRPSEPELASQHAYTVAYAEAMMRLLEAGQQ
jgi:hypothetical protein